MSSEGRERGAFGGGGMGGWRSLQGSGLRRRKLLGGVLAKALRLLPHSLPSAGLGFVVGGKGRGPPAPPSKTVKECVLGSGGGRWVGSSGGPELVPVGGGRKM